MTRRSGRRRTVVSLTTLLASLALPAVTSPAYATGMSSSFPTGFEIDLTCPSLGAVRTVNAGPSHAFELHVLSSATLIRITMSEPGLNQLLAANNPGLISETCIVGNAGPLGNVGPVPETGQAVPVLIIGHKPR